MFGVSELFKIVLFNCFIDQCIDLAYNRKESSEWFLDVAVFVKICVFEDGVSLSLKM